MGSDGSAVCSAPLMQRPMGGRNLYIGTAVEDDCCLASRCRHASDITFANEEPDYLDAKIDRHDARTFVMIEKNVVALGPQTGVLAQESPNAVERRFECCGNILYRDSSAHRGENSRGKRLNFHFIRHDI